MGADRLDLAAQRAVVNGGCENPLPAEGDSFAVYRLSPAEFGADRDFSQPLGFARE